MSQEMRKEWSAWFNGIRVAEEASGKAICQILSSGHLQTTHVTNTGLLHLINKIKHLCSWISDPMPAGIPLSAACRISGMRGT
jgi:hypothetical protein